MPRLLEECISVIKANSKQATSSMYHGCLRNAKGPCVIILMTSPPHVNSMKVTSSPDRTCHIREHDHSREGGLLGRASNPERTDGGVRAGEESEGAPLSRRQCLIMPSISDVIASEDEMMSVT